MKKIFLPFCNKVSKLAHFCVEIGGFKSILRETRFHQKLDLNSMKKKVIKKIFFFYHF